MNIPTKDGWLLIYPCDISYIRSDDIYAYLHNGTEKYFVNISLKDIEEVLDSSLFLRWDYQKSKLCAGHGEW